MTTPVVNTRPTPEQPPRKKQKPPPPRAIHSRGGTAPHDHSCGQHTPDTGATPKKKTTPPPRAIHSRGGTAPHDHSCGQHTPDTGATPKKKTKTPPLVPSTPVVARRRMTTPVVNTRPTPEQPPKKKQHRHSGIFRVADLGPGTMPRGKYPESPAPAGSHALISRTPTPGGMLHANLGLPRPPPRNFQPPLPRFPSRLSPRPMSGTTVGRILSHPRSLGTTQV